MHTNCSIKIITTNSTTRYIPHCITDSQIQWAKNGTILEMLVGYCAMTMASLNCTYLHMLAYCTCLDIFQPTYSFFHDSAIFFS